MHSQAVVELGFRLDETVASKMGCGRRENERNLLGKHLVVIIIVGMSSFGVICTHFFCVRVEFFPTSLFRLVEWMSR